MRVEIIQEELQPDLDSVKKRLVVVANLVPDLFNFERSGLDIRQGRNLKDNADAPP